MVLEKQDSGISLASVGLDKKMPNVPPTDSHHQVNHGSKINSMEESDGNTFKYIEPTTSNGEFTHVKEGLQSGSSYEDLPAIKSQNDGQGLTCIEHSDRLSDSIYGSSQDLSYGEQFDGSGSLGDEEEGVEDFVGSHSDELKRFSDGDTHDGEELHLPLHKTVCCALCRKKQERLKKNQEATPKNNNNNKIHHNYNDASSVASSSRSSRSLWKDPTADARPIADPALRSKLQSAKGLKVTPRDQKILEMMLKKREDDKKAVEKSEKVKSRWEAEIEQETAMKVQTANEKRRTLMEERRLKELQRAASDVGSSRFSGMRKVYSASEANLNRYQDQKLSKQLQRKRSEENLHSYRDSKASEDQLASAAMRAMEAKQRQVEVKRRQSMERRKSVEKRLEERRKEEQEMNNLLLEKQKKELKRAQSVKESKEKEQLLKSKLRNYETRKKTEERIHLLKQQSAEDSTILRETLEEKLRTAEKKAAEEKRRKEEEVRRSALDQKIQQSKQNQKKLDSEMEGWRKELLEYRKLQESKAEEKARRAVLEKKKRAAEDRRTKEKLVKDNMKKLMEQEEEWKADVEATIAMKDAKARVVQMEKEEMIQESRALAHASQKLREELRSQYSANDIDRLNKQTQLENKVLNKPMASLNIS